MKIKKLAKALAIAAIVGISVNVFADATPRWTVDFESYSTTDQSFTNDTANGGSWLWTDGDESSITNIVDTNNALKLRTEGESLVWTPDSVEAEQETIIETEVFFVGATEAPKNITDDNTIQTATYLKIYTGDNGEVISNNLCVYVSDFMGTGNVWEELPLASVIEDTWATLTINIDYVVDPPLVSFSIGGTLLSNENSDGGKFQVANSNTPETKVNSIAFRGTGMIDNFTGKQIEPVTLPTITFAGFVSTNGSPIFANINAFATAGTGWSVTQGATFTVSLDESIYDVDGLALSSIDIYNDNGAANIVASFDGTTWTFVPGDIVTVNGLGEIMIDVNTTTGYTDDEIVYNIVANFGTGTTPDPDPEISFFDTVYVDEVEDAEAEVFMLDTIWTSTATDFAFTTTVATATSGADLSSIYIYTNEEAYVEYTIAYDDVGEVWTVVEENVPEEGDALGYVFIDDEDAVAIAIDTTNWAMASHAIKVFYVTPEPDPVTVTFEGTATTNGFATAEEAFTSSQWTGEAGYTFIATVADAIDGADLVSVTVTGVTYTVTEGVVSPADGDVTVDAGVVTITVVTTGMTAGTYAISAVYTTETPEPPVMITFSGSAIVDEVDYEGDEDTVESDDWEVVEGTDFTATVAYTIDMGDDVIATLVSVEVTNTTFTVDYTDEVWTVTPADGAVSVDEFGVVTVAVDTTGLSDVATYVVVATYTTPSTPDPEDPDAPVVSSVSFDGSGNFVVVINNGDVDYDYAVFTTINLSVPFAYASFEEGVNGNMTFTVPATEAVKFIQIRANQKGSYPPSGN